MPLIKKTACIWARVGSYVGDLEEGEVLEEGVSVGGGGPVLSVLPVLLAEALASTFGSLDVEFPTLEIYCTDSKSVLLTTFYQ